MLQYRDARQDLRILGHDDLWRHPVRRARERLALRDGVSQLHRLAEIGQPVAFSKKTKIGLVKIHFPVGTWFRGGYTAVPGEPVGGGTGRGGRYFCLP